MRRGPRALPTLVAAVAVVEFAGACIRVGPRAERYPPAISARGAATRLYDIHEPHRAVASGELIAVTDSGVVVNDGAHLVHVVRARYLVAEVKGVGRFELRPDARWAAIAARFRPVSRFPQGLSPELERRYVAARR